MPDPSHELRVKCGWRWAAVPLATALMLAGPAAVATAAPSPFVTVSGRVVEEGGVPVGGVTVTLDRTTGALQGFSEGFEAFASLGLAPLVRSIQCTLLGQPLSGVCPPVYRHATVTDQAGRFSFQVRGSDADSASFYTLAAARPTRPGEVQGPESRVTTKFKSDAGLVRVPDLIFWGARPTVRIEGRNTIFPLGIGAMPSPPAGAKAYFGGDITEVTTGLQLTTLVAPRPGPADVALDSRVFEDSRPAVRVTVGAGAFTWTSARLAFNPVSGPPPSRGMACTVSNGIPQVPCRLTDGDLTSPGFVLVRYRDNSIGYTLINPAVVDLGALRRVTFVVARCTCAPQTSVDGSTWTTFVKPPDGQAVEARYVRTPANNEMTAPSEISVWW